MTPASDLAKMVPGFDFLQGLMKNAGAGLPHIGQWVAPTLDPDELEKRIQDLRTVQFWLEQNARLLATTIQALEVQRMTLSTLKTMNLPMADLTEALKIKRPEAAPPPPSAPVASPSSAARPASARKKPAAAPAAAPMIDPMQWWGALTQQFTDLAAKAVKDSTGEVARNLAGAVVKQGVDTATATLQKAAQAPVKAARAASGAVRGAARRR